MRNPIFYLFFFLVFLVTSSFAKEYHVSTNGNDTNDGTVNEPFLTISEAVKHAWPGDIITVHEGIYREWINPIRGGENDDSRIVYQAALGEKVEIKGSEIIKGWKKVKDGVWKVLVDNALFGDYNPYLDSIHGDWFYDHGRIHHTGEVFLNGKSLYEKESLDKVYNPKPGPDAIDKKGATFTWYCETDTENTTIWANFQKSNPNKEMVEISVRSTCFYPDKPGVNYITLRGFHFSQAAIQWAPPTAEQIGMIATHWNKGWIIENNIISDSKCSGITLGKERGTGHNTWSADKSIRGSIHYIEVTFKTIRNGWNKEYIGSHIVRYNTIYNCEQTGMCGSMGAAFSIIENNHIYNIWTKRQFSGAEIAGIKFHAAIDAIIQNNRIHNSGKGIWLDWMTQGTRVSSNLFYNNDIHDLWIEVNHGPFIVDNNIFLSPLSIQTMSQGGAFVQNLIAGRIYVLTEASRFTPYHLPQSTDIAGFSTIYSGDDRYYNNIFIGGGKDKGNKESGNYGLEDYDKAELPMFVSDNIYYNDAGPIRSTDTFIDASKYNPGIVLIEEADEVYLKLTLDANYYNHKVRMVTTDLLGFAKIPKVKYENPDGSFLKIDKDFFGNKREELTSTGPFIITDTGEVKLKVW